MKRWNFRAALIFALDISTLEVRLLIITPFDKAVKRVTVETAKIRNQLMIELADKIVIGFASKGGVLESQMKNQRDEVIIL